MDKFKSHLNKHWPFYLIIICGLFFSVNFRERLDLPIWDEASYSRGTFKNAHGWSPLYQVIYFLFNSFTADRVNSFFYIFFLLTFMLFPILFMLVIKKLGKSNYLVFSSGFLVLTAPWNFLVTPKVQIFNLLFFFLILLYRLTAPIDNFWKRYGIYYALIAVSVFIRQDNLIFLGISFVMDARRTIVQQRNTIKFFIGIPAIISLSMISTFYLLGETYPSHPRRSINAFVDHHYWNNRNTLKFKDHRHLSKIEWHEQVLGNATSITDVFISGRVSFLEHFQSGLKRFFTKLEPKIFSRNLSNSYFYISWINLAWLNLFVFVFINFFQPGNSQVTLKRVHKYDVIIFIVGIVVKCITISLLLSPWIQYLVDLVICVLILIAIVPSFHNLNSMVFHKTLTLILVLSLIGYNYQNQLLEPSRDKPENNLSFYNSLTKFVRNGCIEVAVIGPGVGEWISNISKIFVGGFCSLSDRDSLLKCLENYNVDSIIYDHDFQNKIKSNWANKEFIDLFRNPELFNFQKTISFDSDFGDDLVLYTRISKKECNQK
jgi:hypothetical protein